MHGVARIINGNLLFQKYSQGCNFLSSSYATIIEQFKNKKPKKYFFCCSSRYSSYSYRFWSNFIRDNNRIEEGLEWAKSASVSSHTKNFPGMHFIRMVGESVLFRVPNLINIQKLMFLKELKYFRPLVCEHVFNKVYFLNCVLNIQPMFFDNLLHSRMGDSSSPIAGIF